MDDEIQIRKIRIFVAGSKQLKAERDFVKSIVSDFNAKFLDMSLGLKPYFFCVYDYTCFYPAQRKKGLQEELYNTFIDSNADLVFFLLDGKMGSKTEEEFNVAINAIIKDRRPKHPDIHVFGKKGINPIDIEIVKDYFIDYSNSDNLEKSIIDILHSYIENVEKSKVTLREKYNKIVSDRELDFINFLIMTNPLV